MNYYSPFQISLPLSVTKLAKVCIKEQKKFVGNSNQHVENILLTPVNLFGMDYSTLEHLETKFWFCTGIYGKHEI